MGIVLPTLSRITTLLIFIVIGYILEKCKLMPNDTTKTLSKCENYLFIPALVLGTFVKNFTMENLKSLWQLLIFSFIVEIIMCFIAFFISKAITKDHFKQNIYTYGLAFSNFGFFGNALVNAIFPEYFIYYIIFTIPMWAIIYIWAVPNLLMNGDKKKSSIKDLINPMFIALIIGGLIGILKIKIPFCISETVTELGNCMSPIAMLITGITLGKIKFKYLLNDISVYIVSIIRLIILPLAVSLLVKYLFLSYLSLPDYFYICLVCSLAMPLGLNTVVVPSAYGTDVTVPTSMALISHILSAITIPLVFFILRIG